MGRETIDGRGRVAAAGIHMPISCSDTAMTDLQGPQSWRERRESCRRLFIHAGLLRSSHGSVTSKKMSYLKGKVIGEKKRGLTRNIFIRRLTTAQY